jgi:hypothetical protein
MPETRLLIRLRCLGAGEAITDEIKQISAVNADAIRPLLLEIGKNHHQQKRRKALDSG